jgi:hypothetical protein
MDGGTPIDAAVFLRNCRPRDLPWGDVPAGGLIQLVVVRENGGWTARWEKYVHEHYETREEAIMLSNELVTDLIGEGRLAELWVYDPNDDIPLPICHRSCGYHEIAVAIGAPYLA